MYKPTQHFFEETFKNQTTNNYLRTRPIKIDVICLSFYFYIANAALVIARKVNTTRKWLVKGNYTFKLVRGILFYYVI